ncbi:MAG: TetR/AcrR family transcriptional regulator [Acidobacteriota bacterium]
MPRHREFDTDQALEAAIRTFQDKGYQGTSVSDLLDALGIQKGSLYKAWGSKRKLFLTALDRYFRQQQAGLKAALSESPKAALHQVFEYTVSRCVLDEGRGCLAVNSCVELAQLDEEIQRLSDEHVSVMVGAIAVAIQRGQRDGEFRTDVPAEVLADSLYTSIVGLLARGRSLIPQERLLAIGRLAVESLER